MLAQDLPQPLPADLVEPVDHLPDGVLAGGQPLTAVRVDPDVFRDADQGTNQG